MEICKVLPEIYINIMIGEAPRRSVKLMHMFMWS